MVLVVVDVVALVKVDVVELIVELSGMVVAEVVGDVDEAVVVGLVITTMSVKDASNITTKKKRISTIKTGPFILAIMTFF